MTEVEKKFLRDLVLEMLNAVRRREQSGEHETFDAARAHAFKEVFARCDFDAFVVTKAEEPQLCLDSDPEQERIVLAWCKCCVYFGIFLAFQGLSLPESYDVESAPSEREVLH